METEKLKRKGRRKRKNSDKCPEKSLCYEFSRMSLLPVSAADSVLFGGGKVAHCTLRDVISSHHYPLYRRLGPLHTAHVSLFARSRIVVAMRAGCPLHTAHVSLFARSRIAVHSRCTCLVYNVRFCLCLWKWSPLRLFHLRCIPKLRAFDNIVLTAGTLKPVTVKPH
jgi:hypothetical protein